MQIKICYTQIPVNTLFVIKMSWPRFQRNNFLSSKLSSRRLQDVLQDMFKTSSSRFEDVLKGDKLIRWIRLQVVFKTCLEDVFWTSWIPTNVCWESVSKNTLWQLHAMVSLFAMKYISANQRNAFRMYSKIYIGAFLRN